MTSFCGHLPRYHKRMASIGSYIVVILVNRELSDAGHLTFLMLVSVTTRYIYQWSHTLVNDFRNETKLQNVNDW